MNWTIRGGAVVLGAAFLAGIIGFASRGNSADVQGAGGNSSSGPHFTVVETDGHNLVITDHAKSVLYFYTVDKGQTPGSDLKLRASVDLNEVGKPVIKPKDVNIQK